MSGGTGLRRFVRPMRTGGKAEAGSGGQKQMRILDTERVALAGHPLTSPAVASPGASLAGLAPDQPAQEAARDAERSAEQYQTLAAELAALVGQRPTASPGASLAGLTPDRAAALEAARAAENSAGRGPTVEAEQAALATGALEREVLTYPACGLAYNVRLACRLVAESGGDLPLDPQPRPLLNDSRAVRVAIPEAVQA